MEVRWQVENNTFCQRVLAKHWPNIRRYGDITSLTGAELESVDMICGGFPCQPVSQAGKQIANARSQEGQPDDKRWLWPHFARLLGVLRPRYALVENVPGLFTANDGRAFGEVVGDLAALGYDCEWQVISAADVGAPHLRKRVWIVAHAESVNGAGAEPEGNRGWRSQKTARDSGESRVTLADANDEVQPRRTFYADSWASLSEFTSGHQWWSIEPKLGRVAHGIPKRVDRLRGLGNAVVPQVAEWIGKRILLSFDDTRVLKF